MFYYILLIYFNIFMQTRLCSVFPQEEDYESQVWQGLVLVGVGLTLATLVMLGRS